MKDVRIKKEKLLKVLKANRAEHREIFEEAQKGYRETVITILDDRLKQARKGQPIDMRFNIIEPQDQTADYDRAIRMLEMSEDKIIELDEHDFACYVLDNWAWKERFLTSNSLYSQKARGISR